jgi:hypothetical protein
MAAGLLAVLLSAAPSAGGKAQAPRSTRWTSGAELVQTNGLATLAVVRGRTFAPFEVCDWEDTSRHGSRWHAVDAWGKVVGTLQLDAADGQGELRVLQGTHGVRVYVSESARWSPPPSARWQPSAQERASFEQWRKRLRDHAGARKGDVRFFASHQPRREFAVVAGYEHVWIAEHVESGAWRLAHDEDAGDSRWPLFRVRTILDLTGDGMPEIVVHFNEYEDGRGHEIVLTALRGGKSWREVSNNFDDCP